MEDGDNSEDMCYVARTFHGQLKLHPIRNLWEIMLPCPMWGWESGVLIHQPPLEEGKG